MSYSSRNTTLPAKPAWRAAQLTSCMKCLPGSSFGWALPAKTIWTGLPAPFRMRIRRSAITEQEGCALIGGKAPGKPERQCIRVEHLFDGHRLAIAVRAYQAASF